MLISLLYIERRGFAEFFYFVARGFNPLWNTGIVIKVISDLTVYLSPATRFQSNEQANELPNSISNWKTIFVPFRVDKWFVRHGLQVRLFLLAFYYWSALGEFLLHPKPRSTPRFKWNWLQILRIWKRGWKGNQHLWRGSKEAVKRCKVMRYLCSPEFSSHCVWRSGILLVQNHKYLQADQDMSRIQFHRNLHTFFALYMHTFHIVSYLFCSQTDVFRAAGQSSTGNIKVWMGKLMPLVITQLATTKELSTKKMIG